MTDRVSRVGQQVPAANLAELRDDKVVTVPSRELFAGRRVILFALPGAFTPTCSTAHVPGYVARLQDFRGAGIDDVVCLSVNDPYVMAAWKRSEKAQGIRFVADPYAEFTQAMGMSVDHRDASLGTRSWRYSMLVEQEKISAMFIEPDVPGDPFQVSDADTLWTFLRPGQKPSGSALLLGRHGCPYCARATQLLQDNGIAFEAIYLGDGLSMQGVKAAAGAATVPQVFIDGKLIGGAQPLQAFLAQRRS